MCESYSNEKKNEVLNQSHPAHQSGSCSALAIKLVLDLQRLGRARMASRTPGQRGARTCALVQEGTRRIGRARLPEPWGRRLK
jgi:hypothetical protein